MSYSDDAPEIRDDTDIDELIEYTRRRVADPIEIGDVTIYHFNSHDPDIDALEKAVEEKLEREVYQVPFQVTSGWHFMMDILPQKIREAEMLIYKEDKGEYYAYNTFLRETPVESRQKLRQDFAELIRE